MQNLQKFIPSIIALVAVVLVGGYFIFREHAAPVSDTPLATSTGVQATSTPSSAPAAPKTIITQSGDFKVSVDTTHLYVGGSLSPLSFTLPAGNNDGKLIVLLLRPASATSTLKAGLLLTTTIHPKVATYQILGLKLKTLVDDKSASFAITPGEYILQATLWDHSPYVNTGTPNNAVAAMTQPFTIAPAP